MHYHSGTFHQVQVSASRQFRLNSSHLQFVSLFPQEYPMTRQQLTKQELGLWHLEQAEITKFKTDVHVVGMITHWTLIQDLLAACACIISTESM